jgi:integrase
VTVSAGRELSHEEILAFITTCQKDKNKKAGIRDAAMITLMYAAGLRRREVVKLALKAFNEKTRQLTVIGKYQKKRVVSLGKGVADALANWIRIRGTEGEAFFIEVNRGGNLDPSKYLTSEAIYVMLMRRAREAGIQNFSPYDLHHTFISRLLRAKVRGLVTDPTNTQTTSYAAQKRL